jgi:aspartyl aminopeptidase
MEGPHLLVLGGMSDDAHDLLSFLAASPSPFHCVAEAARRLDSQGFQALDEGAPPEDLPPGSARYVTRGGTLIAWRAGTSSPVEAGFRILAAHTDSPNLRIKPDPEMGRHGWVQWGVEMYGGVLLSTWMDRDLGLSGRVAVRGSSGVSLHLVRVDRPVARVPNLAIHMDRTVNQTGMKINAHKHLSPVVALCDAVGADDREGGQDRLQKLVGEALGVDPGDILGWDLGLHDLQAPTLGGLDDEFVFSARLDNQFSAHCVTAALAGHEKETPATAVAVLFDHEEVGSTSAQGAQSALLRNTLDRILRDHTAQAPGGYERAAAHSCLVSADMAHALHPNYPEKHDGLHMPMLNAGPVLKSNARLRYATDAAGRAWVKQAGTALGLEVQEYIHRADMACGTTIGPITSATLGIRTADIGCAMLSMHSIREQAGARDVAPMTGLLGQLLLETMPT